MHKTSQNQTTWPMDHVPRILVIWQAKEENSLSLKNPNPLFAPCKLIHPAPQSTDIHLTSLWLNTSRSSNVMCFFLQSDRVCYDCSLWVLPEMGGFFQHSGHSDGGLSLHNLITLLCLSSMTHTQQVWGALPCSTGARDKTVISARSSPSLR